MNNSEMDDLFTQIRTAHRLLAAYYQRLLPVIESIALEADTEFYFWSPHRFSPPGQSNANPFKKWQWDLLPAVVTRYVFKHVNDLKRITKGDYIIEFLVVNDSGIDDEKSKSQPDALTLKVGVNEARSILKLAVYRAVQDEDSDFYKKWNSISYSDYSDSIDVQLDHKFVTAGFEVPLNLLMSDSGVHTVKAKIDQYLLITQEAVSAYSADNGV
ncbi:hypothetical protein FLM48_02450 [Shewanella sp. Scap07]|uniref:hypothetical protein n=1 Tax=Shewanella sp. Scap07 TaxID=2589987 RepID=UPI0015BB9CB0|nr:hypothetical protein [Shewanella sp. Scap07]QLE84043.1 hypothetical protein FLM48_02450 [Shewanella sp. Scap07]